MSKPRFNRQSERKTLRAKVGQQEGRAQRGKNLSEEELRAHRGAPAQKEITKTWGIVPKAISKGSNTFFRARHES